MERRAMSLGAVRIHDLVRAARARNASDVHLGAGERPALRVDGRLVLLDTAPVDSEGIDAFLRATLGAAHLARLDRDGSADTSVASDGGRYRLHAYRHTGGIRLAVRLLATSVPSLDQLGMPPVVATFAQQRAGLVLFTGPTGSGKTTALAALVDRINRTSDRNLVTVEDPVEYVHLPERSLVTHCEIGRDTPTFAEALRAVLRADPDVILVGELRDVGTMEAALAAAETGHLVLTTLHTADAAQSVERIADAFPPAAHAPVRAQLASVLVAVVALRLVPRLGGGRCTAAEVLVATDAVRALIRDGKTHQLRNAIVTGRAVGMQTLETHLTDLVVRGTVGLADAQAVATRPAEVRGTERIA
jgi:twitching motility protein PilT